MSHLGPASGASSDRLVPPMNAPGAGQPVPGTQPGVSGGIVVAHLVIITASGGWFIYSGTPGPGNPPIIWASGSLTDPYGNALPEQFGITGSGIFGAGDTLITPAGIFAYSGTPAAGNLIASIAGTAGTDGFGNAYKQGIYLYGSTGSSIGLFNNIQAGIDMLPPGPVTSLTLDPTVFAKSLNPGAVNEQTFVTLSSGKESGRNDAAVQVFSDSADGTLVATTTIEFGGGIYVQVNTSVFTIFSVPLLLKNQNVPNVQLLPFGSSTLTANSEYQASFANGGAANEQILAVIGSGKESSHDDAAVQLWSESADTTVAARVVLEFGGTVQMQVDKTRTILQSQSSAPAQSSGNAALYADSLGALKVVDGTDAQAYSTQRRTLVLGSDTPLSSSGTTVFTDTVGVRSYRVHGMILVSVTTAVQQLSVNVSPPTGTGFVGGHIGRSTNFIDYVDYNLNTLTAVCGVGTLGVGARYLYFFDSIMNVTSAGNLHIILACTNTGDLTALANSYVEILPI